MCYPSVLQCVRVCVCVLSEMIMCGTPGPLKLRICRIWTVKGDRGDEERKEDMSEEK